MTPENSPPDGPPRIVRRVEDALTIMSVLALMVVAIGFCPGEGEAEAMLWRETTAGHVALGVLFVLMLVIFIRRLRRVHQAFRDLNDDY